jgi:Na+/H+ antiporter NhaD/arsenite permease-like protein
VLLFFAALFVVPRGVRGTPPVDAATTAALGRLHGAGVHDAAIVSAAMLVLSNLVSNVPAVLLWRHAVGALPHARFVWLVMAMSATFAGNLTLLGSMANLIVAERAAARGVVIGFWDYLKIGVPVTLLTMAWGVVVLSWLSWLS